MYMHFVIGVIAFFVVVTYTIGFLAPPGYGFTCSDTQHGLLAILYLNIFTLWSIYVICSICRGKMLDVKDKNKDQVNEEADP